MLRASYSDRAPIVPDNYQDVLPVRKEKRLPHPIMLQCYSNIMGFKILIECWDIYHSSGF